MFFYFYAITEVSMLFPLFFTSITDLLPICSMPFEIWSFFYNFAPDEDRLSVNIKIIELCI